MIEEMAYSFVNDARHFANMECFRNAFNLYLLAIEKYPRVKKRIEGEFRVVLMRLNEYLAVVEKNRPAIFHNFQAAIRVYPGNVNLLNDIGSYLLKHSYFFEALCHFEKALTIDSSHVSIQKVLDVTKKALFPRPNFRMLNDRRRNEAYLAAIHAAITPGYDNVLNIESAGGLLALYANVCAPLSNIACHSVQSTAKLAERIMLANKARDVIVLHKPIPYLMLNDVYGERSLLITNKFDSGLLGEHILQTLKHAWENLLDSDAGVVPCRADFYVMGARCDRINAKYQLCTSSKKLLNIPDLFVHTSTLSGESYYGEELNLYDDIEYMTDEQHLFRINFNHYEDIVHKYRRTLPYNAYLRANRSGEINVLVGWFNLHLTDSIVLTSDPRSANRCTAWQQAVFFDFIPKTVEENERTCVQFLTYDGRLTLLPDIRKYITRISAPTIAFLNDTQYVDAIVGCIQTATVYLGQIVDMSRTDIVDLCPFPLFGLLMMKRGAQSLVCHARSASDKTFIELAFTINDIPLSKLTILVEDYWNHNVFKDQTYHAIFCNGLDLNGDIDMRMKRLVQHLKHAHLVPGGLYLPANVTLVGQLISSDWLERNHRLYDENLCGFKLASHVNKYRVSQAYCIDMSRLDYTALSAPTVLSQCCNYMRSEVIRVPVSRDGECNAVLCWYEIRLLDKDDELSTSRRNSFVDSTAFFANPTVSVHRGDVASVIRCVDYDGSYKLVVDLELG